MIKLDIKPYCEECMDFEAETEYPNTWYENNREIPAGDTVIRCRHRSLCSRIVGRLSELTRAE